MMATLTRPAWDSRRKWTCSWPGSKPDTLHLGRTPPGPRMEGIVKATLCSIWVVLAAWIPAPAGAAPNLGLTWNDCYTGGGLDNKSDACNLDFTYHQ